jgi:hypothetical protein
MKNTSVVQQWIDSNHIENTSSSIVVFTVRCTATEVIRLLFEYSFLLECVYRAVGQKRASYIRPLRGRYIATALHAVILTVGLDVY